MAVIAIFLAAVPPMTAPMPSPSATRPMTMGERCMVASVVRMAIAMPTMPYMLPCREVAGDDKPRSAMMNSAPETR